MTETAGFLIYAALFRLAIVGAGALSIWLGFRLFLQDVAAATTGPPTDAEAKIGDLLFSLRGAAPGTCFALFGAAIISVMIWTGLPELSLQEDRGPGTTARSLALKGSPRSSPVPAGPPASTYEDALLRGDGLLTDGRYADAAAAYAAALTDGRVRLGDAARAFNQLAWSMHQLGRHAEAAGLADIAVGLEPDNPVYADTLSRTRAAAERTISETKRNQQGAHQP